MRTIVAMTGAVLLGSCSGSFPAPVPEEPGPIAGERELDRAPEILRVVQHPSGWMFARLAPAPGGFVTLGGGEPAGEPPGGPELTTDWIPLRPLVVRSWTRGGDIRWEHRIDNPGKSLVFGEVAAADDGRVVASFGPRCAEVQCAAGELDGRTLRGPAAIGLTGEGQRAWSWIGQADYPRMVTPLPGGGWLVEETHYHSFLPRPTLLDRDGQVQRTGSWPRPNAASSPAESGFLWGERTSEHFEVGHVDFDLRPTWSTRFPEKLSVSIGRIARHRDRLYIGGVSGPQFRWGGPEALFGKVLLAASLKGEPLWGLRLNGPWILEGERGLLAVDKPDPCGPVELVRLSWDGEEQARARIAEVACEDYETVWLQGLVPTGGDDLVIGLSFSSQVHVRGEAVARTPDGLESLLIQVRWPPPGDPARGGDLR